MWSRAADDKYIHVLKNESSNRTNDSELKHHILHSQVQLKNFPQKQIQTFLKKGKIVCWLWRHVVIECFATPRKAAREQKKKEAC